MVVPSSHGQTPVDAERTGPDPASSRTDPKLGTIRSNPTIPPQVAGHQEPVLAAPAGGSGKTVVVAASAGEVAPTTADEVDLPETRRAELVQVSLFRITPAERTLVGALFLLTVLLTGVHFYRLSGAGLHAVPIEQAAEVRLDFLVDLNNASWVELSLLPGLGESLSKRIVADRESNGPYESVDELDRVKGIGAKTIERLRPWLTVE